MGVSDEACARFLAKVDTSAGHDGCWPWIGYRQRDGYGRFGVRRDGRKSIGYAHRVAWEIAYGQIPDGMCVCHRCDVRFCVNPAHLFIGTDADNAHDRDRKGRSVKLTGERHGNARLSADIVRQIRSASGLHREIASRYGISRETVTGIRAKKSWAHVEDQA